MTDELAVIFQLALTLHTPVYELLEKMPFQEFILWLHFFEQKPRGWEDDLRAYRIMCASGNMKGTKPEDFFPSIAAIKEKEKERVPQAVPHSGSMAHALMSQAKGGAQLSFLEKL